MISLQDVLQWVISGGAGVIAYWLMENISYLKNLAPEAKRYVALAIAIALAVLGYFAQVAMGYQVAPQDARGWIEALFAVAGVAGGLSQIVHARLQLSKRSR